MKICSMKDEDLAVADDPRCDRRRRVQIEKERDLCLLAIRTIDKPNIHRLRELVMSTLPMFGHVVHIGELVLEKAHQSLKRGVHQSNQKQSHLQSLQGVAFNDWQGRLTIQAGGALDGNLDALRGCYRLFYGRDSIMRVQGVIDSTRAEEVRKILGPEPCVPFQLKTQSITVISKRPDGSNTLQWHLGGNRLRLSDLQCIPARNFSDSFLLAFPSFDVSTAILYSAISSRTMSGLPCQNISCGDIVGIVSLNPCDHSFHVPFVVQRDTVHHSDILDLDCDVSFWVIYVLLKIERCGSEASYFAAVLPCQNQNPSYCSHVGSLPRYRIASPPDCAGTVFPFVKMTPSIRNVAVLHDCSQGTCSFDSSTGNLTHGDRSSPLQGGTFFVKTGEMATRLDADSSTFYQKFILISADQFFFK